MKRISMVYCQHGNERIGALIVPELQSMGVECILGNPKAFLKNTRFIDTDMNRSYGKGAVEGYEKQRAKTILKQVEGSDVVIDIHSTKAAVGAVAILPSDDKELLSLTVQLGFHRAVVMPHHIVKDSLIGNAKHSLSLEYGNNIPDVDSMVRELPGKLQKLQFEKPQSGGELEVFYVKDLLPPDFRGAGLRNFRYSKTIKGFPVLVGESRYKTYAGFVADRTKQFVI